MTDIVERLRDMRVTVDQGPLRMEAADEIERLRGEIHSMGAHMAHLHHVNDQLRDKEHVSPAPTGWMLVPVEPTDAMLKAGDAVMEVYENVGACWRNMLNAARHIADQEKKA